MSVETQTSTTTDLVSASSRPAPGLSSRDRQTRPRVMLVDDNDAFLSAMELLLPRLFEIEIVASEQTGPGALEKLKDIEVDLVIVDYKMPGLNGLTFARRAREGHIWTRILLVTFNPSPTLEVDARDYGADGVINKAEIQEDLLQYLPRWFGCSSH